MEVERRSLKLNAGRFERENERTEKYTLADELPAKLAGLNLRIPMTQEKRKPDYTVRMLTQDDKEDILDFLRKTFFVDEPMNHAVELLPTPDSRCTALEEYASSSLDDGVSLATVDKDGRLVGVILNGLVRREDVVDVAEKASACPDAKFSRVLRVLAHLDEHGRVWEHVHGDRLLEVRIVSTHPDWRGRGLMKRLCEETEDIARRLGCGAIRMDTTSAFSACAAERLRYSRLYSVPYADIPGTPVLPDHPHTAASVYIKTL